MTTHYSVSFEQMCGQYIKFFEFCDRNNIPKIPTNPPTIYSELTKLSSHTMWLFINNVLEPGNEWVIDLRSRYIHLGGEIL